MSDPCPLSHRDPDTIIRVVRAFKEMGANIVQIGDVRVRFDPFEPANVDVRDENAEQAAKEQAAKTEGDLFWSV